MISGIAMIFQQGAKARVRSDRTAEGSLPRKGDFWEIEYQKDFFFLHIKMPLFGVG